MAHPKRSIVKVARRIVEVVFINYSANVEVSHGDQRGALVGIVRTDWFGSFHFLSKCIFIPS